MTRAAIYARYSTDLQSDASVEDQIRICEEYAERQGWQVVNHYKDRAQSGANLLRPGVQSLLADARAGDFDVILSEALDRISRDQADIASVYRDMGFNEVEMHTLSEGKIDHLHIGLKGTMNALFLKDLKTKIRRGMRGRIENGKSGGGIGYGYEVVKKLDANGEPIKGDRKIVEAQAVIIRRIFSEYNAGNSPRAIAKGLNDDGIDAPRGKQWSQSTINGNRKRGTGILNNDLYRGKLIWNRQKMVKDPSTGKRITRTNPESEWIIHEVPELRIVEQDEWDKAKERQGALTALATDALRKGGGVGRTVRPKYLLTGLLKCACCCGSYTQRNHYQLSCATQQNAGTCDNKLRVKRDEVEQAVLRGLKNRMMAPELFKEFCDEYTRRMNELRMERTQKRRLMENELRTIERKLDALVESIFEGVNANIVNNKCLELEARKAELEAELETQEEPVALLHPSLALRYQQQLEALNEALNDADGRGEAFEAIRGLIDRVVITPTEESYSLAIEGDLAAILNLAGGEDLQGSKGQTEISEILLVAEEAHTAIRYISEIQS